ncbi:MAG: nitroreductase family protein [Candidatus Hodarchaeales archaeon]
MTYLQELVNKSFTDNFFQLISGRRSIRKYQAFDVPDADIEKMLNASRLAPSAENSQPWRFLIIKDSETKNFLAQKAGNQKFIADANVLVLVLGNKGVSCCPRTRWYLQDPMIAAEHLVLAATALGYGTCWVGLLETESNKIIHEIKEVLKIPDGIYTICLITIGLPAESPSPRPRKSLRELCFKETYGNSWDNTIPEKERLIV